MTSVIRVVDGMSSMSRGKEEEEGRHESRKREDTSHEVPSRPPLLTAGWSLLVLPSIERSCFTIMKGRVHSKSECGLRPMWRGVHMLSAHSGSIPHVPIQLWCIWTWCFFRPNFSELFFQFIVESTHFEQQCKSKSATQWNASQRKTCYMQSLQSHDRRKFLLLRK